VVDQFESDVLDVHGNWEAGVDVAGRAIVVSHGGVTTDLLRDVLGEAGLRSRVPSLIEEGVPCCGLTTLQATAGGWAAKSIAVCDHLTDGSSHRPG
jgi:hypothetical protein